MTIHKAIYVVNFTELYSDRVVILFSVKKTEKLIFEGIKRNKSMIKMADSIWNEHFKDSSTEQLNKPWYIISPLTSIIVFQETKPTNIILKTHKHLLLPIKQLFI
jgi:hypothetical protein